MSILILSYDRALCLDLDFELLLDLYIERNLHRINDCQLNIKYATEVCYCCLLKGSFAK